MELDAAGRLVYSHTVCLRGQQMLSSRVAEPGARAWPSQLSVFQAEVCRATGAGPPPKLVVVLVPVTALAECDDPIPARACGSTARAAQEALGAVAACFPRAVLPKDARSSESSDSDDSADGNAAGASAAAAKRAKAKTDGWASMPACDAAWEVVPSLSELLASGARCGGSRLPLHAVVAADLSGQYGPRPAPKGTAGSRVTSFLCASVELTLAGAGGRGEAEGAATPSSAVAPSAKAAALGPPGASAPAARGGGSALLERLHGGGAGYRAGADQPLAVVAGAALHAAPATAALFLPSRSAPLCLLPLQGGDGAAPGTGKAVREALAAAAGASQPWHATLYSVGSMRRADWHGGGKTAAEAEDEMRRRFASGSMRKLVPASRVWQEARAAVARALGLDARALPASDPRVRKVVAGPNSDSFTMLVR